MTPTNTCSISGTIIETPRPGQGKTALFRLEHRQAFQGKGGEIQTTGFALWCRAWGHGASSILRYGKAGLDVVVNGRLGYVSETNSIGIVCDSIAYPRPSQLANSEKSASD